MRAITKNNTQKYVDTQYNYPIYVQGSTKYWDPPTAPPHFGTGISQNERLKLDIHRWTDTEGSVDDVLREFRCMGIERPITPAPVHTSSRWSESSSTSESSSVSTPSCSSSPLPKECSFCKNNGEMISVYGSHNLKDRRKIICPILRKHVCPFCGATGDAAHTNKYCPKAKNMHVNLPIPMSTVRKQFRNAAGKRTWSP